MVYDITKNKEAMEVYLYIKNSPGNNFKEVIEFFGLEDLIDECPFISNIIHLLIECGACYQDEEGRFFARGLKKNNHMEESWISGIIQRNKDNALVTYKFVEQNPGCNISDMKTMINSGHSADFGEHELIRHRTPNINQLGSTLCRLLEENKLGVYQTRWYANIPQCQFDDSASYTNQNIDDIRSLWGSP